MTDTEKTKTGATNGTESEVKTEPQEEIVKKNEPSESIPDNKSKTNGQSTAEPKKDSIEKVESKEEKKGIEESEKKDAQTETTEGKQQESQLQVKFSIEIPKKDIDKGFEEALEKYAGEIKLPGFRKGKVPVEVIKSRYKDAIKDEVINQVVEEAVFNKIEKEKMRIISRPEVININYEEGKDLTADVQVELFPTIELTDLETLEVEVPTNELKEEEFDEKKHIDYFLESHQRRVPVDREIKDGDYITLKHQFKVLPGKRMSPRKEAYFMVNKEEKFEILDLYQEVLGKGSGAELTFTRSYPEDYQKRPWAGKEVEHYVTIENVFEMVKPELTPEFLKSIGFEKEEDFKNKLKEEFDRVQTQRIEDKQMKYIIDALCESITFPLPQGMVEQETKQRLAQGQARYLVDMKDEKQVKEYENSIKSEAEKSIRFSFIVEAVKEKFKLEVSNDDLENHYKSLAEKNNLPIREIRKYYMNKENSQSLKDSLLREKAIDLIKGKCQIKKV